MTNKYPFSPQTVEGEALKKLSEEEQVATLQNTGVWDNAHAENENVRRILDNSYEGMYELTLTLPNGETKKIHVKLFLEADDSALKYTLSNGVKSNFPKDEIKDNPLLITKNKDGQYHFGHTASENRLTELGMRALTDEEMNSPELSKYVAGNTKLFPGFRNANGSVFGYIGDRTCFWGSSIDGDLASRIVFDRGDYEIFRPSGIKSLGCCLLGVMD